MGLRVLPSDGFGSKYFDPGWAGQILLPGPGLMGSAIFGLGLAFENFPLKSQIFQFFALQVKKILSGQVKKYMSKSRVSLIFTAGQKYAWVGLGQGPSLVLP